MCGATPHWTKLAASNVARSAGDPTSRMISAHRAGPSP